MSDHWVWEGSSNGKFSSKIVYKQVRPRLSQVAWADIVWTKGATTKMKLCTYKVIRDWLLTRDRLARFGIHVPSLDCVLGGRGAESGDHLFFQCYLSESIYIAAL